MWGYGRYCTVQYCKRNYSKTPSRDTHGTQAHVFTVLQTQSLRKKVTGSRDTLLDSVTGKKAEAQIRLDAASTFLDATIHSFASAGERLPNLRASQLVLVPRTGTSTAFCRQCRQGDFQS